MVCLDTSEFMRNGDYTPTRLGAMQDAVNSPFKHGPAAMFRCRISNAFL